MTISSTNSRWVYDGDGMTTVFPFDNLVTEKSALTVYVDGSPLTVDVDYSIIGIGVTSGGYVTMSAAPPSGDGNVNLVRDEEETQESSFPAGGPLPASVLERAVDKLTILIQQLRSLADARSIALQLSDPAVSIGRLPLKSTLAGYLLGFDEFGDPMAYNRALSSSVQRFRFTTTTDNYSYTLVDLDTSSSIDATDAWVLLTVGEGWTPEQGIDFTVSGSTLTFAATGEFATGVLGGLRCYGHVTSALTSGEVKTGAVTTTKLADGAVTSDKISSVSGGKVIEASLPLGKISTAAGAGVVAFAPSGVPSFVAATDARKKLTILDDGTVSWQHSTFVHERAVFQYTTDSGVSPVIVGSGISDIPLNTVAINTIAGASLDTGTAWMTLPAGTYLIDAVQAMQGGGTFLLSLYNESDLVYVLDGQPGRNPDTGNYTRATVRGWFTLAGAKTLTLKINTNAGGSGLGPPSSFGRPNIYCDCQIWRTAP